MPIPKLLKRISEDKNIMDDFVKTFVEFAHRHGETDVTPDDFKIGPADASLAAEGAPPPIWIYRDGPTTSRWIKSH